ncbi:MAG: mechanosensitive ion channel family protein, partial [Mariniphaga sp.]|nr:mechanosensitive ion channel family protein [Mariniphaga sp.]
MKQIFTNDFWIKVFESIESWIITELPGLIILTILLIIVFRLVKFALNRVGKRLIKRAEKGDNPVESEKRINTLIG